MAEVRPAEGPDDPDDPVVLAGRLLEIVNGSWMAQAARVAAELGLADLLAAGPLGVAELAGATGAHEPSLRRLLRALVTIGVCDELDGDEFAVTAMGRLLAADADGSVRDWTRYWGRYLWDEWAQLPHSITTGRAGREVVSGSRNFDALREDPERAAVFNGAMADMTRLSARGIVAGYDFSRFARITDVGGGYGELLAGVLLASPAATGVLLDLPHAVAHARANLEKAGVAQRCELVAGSFFAEVPGGSDAYLLKNVLHDWDDERSASILAACRAAMSASSRLLVIERLMPERMEPVDGHRAMARSDLNMLVAHAAQERTEAEFRRLLDGAGLRVGAVTPVPTGLHVIEAFVVD
ncbi:acetylserotonin O-methyltransferase [Pseudonocardia humida]|uniref:Methyltransferase n=1 Tax=Pseudonocardia humida TaxID=2800819 RepID=A0ABT1A2X0_9PSEU|nr:acetylserotonin O-methyltransferase [Pseudonocardia humida]MCO1657338.1 methyltransferase [Pseudonocardia humida]